MLNNKKAFTVIELVVTMTVIAIIAAATAAIIIYVMQLLVYTPREIKAKTVAHEAMEAMIEGETQKRGMRYLVEVQEASGTQFTYVFGYPAEMDRKTMRFRWDNAAGKIYRSYKAFGETDFGQEESIPYYATGEISIGTTPATPNGIFTYFKADGSAWVSGADPLNAIRRVEINIAVATGSGSFARWEGSFEAQSAVEIKQYT